MRLRPGMAALKTSAKTTTKTKKKSEPAKTKGTAKKSIEKPTPAFSDSAKLPKLSARLADTKRVGDNVRVGYEAIGEKDYAVFYVDLTERGDRSGSGRSMVVAKTDNFAKLDGDIGARIIITRKLSVARRDRPEKTGAATKPKAASGKTKVKAAPAKKRRRKRDDDDD